MKNPFGTLKALVLNRRKDKAGKIAENIGTVRRLIDKDLLYVDCEKPYICLSLRLHMAFMDDECKLGKWKFRFLNRLGLVRRDVRYVSFMESVVAFVNFHRGIKGLPVFSLEDRVDFMVMNMGNTRPILVGFYKDGKVEYASFEKGE